MSKKKVLLKVEDGQMTIYEDGTYICSHWQKGDYSEWRLHYGIWEYRHPHQGADWIRRGEDEMLIDRATKIQKILDGIFEKEILGYEEGPA